MRRLVREQGLDVNALIGTGGGGRITRNDVLGHLEAGAAAPAATSKARQPPVPQPTPVSDDPATAALPSTIRRLEGSHTVTSEVTSSQAVSMVEVDFGNIASASDRVGESFRTVQGPDLTYLPFIACAIADALGRFPHLNASVGQDELIVHHDVDLGIVVDLDEGQSVGVVRKADTKRLRAVAGEIGDLAGRARSDGIGWGVTFTISAASAVGSVLTMPTLSRPRVGIVSTGPIVRKPRVVRTIDGEEGITIRPVGDLAMSWGRRAVDSAYVAGFLNEAKSMLETADWSASL